jgi:hypothetical protein
MMTHMMTHILDRTPPAPSSATLDLAVKGGLLSRLCRPEVSRACSALQRAECSGMQ